MVDVSERVGKSVAEGVGDRVGVGDNVEVGVEVRVDVGVMASDGVEVDVGDARTKLNSSIFGPPELVLAVTRIVLVPALKLTLTLVVFQVVQAPVGAKGMSVMVLPLILSEPCRLPVLPLA